MKIKALLLGSAAAIGFSGAAQAADLRLSVAEPVDYVRVCDAFGAGYFYIPGTDTCLRIGGYVRFQVEYSDPDFTVTGDSDEGDSHYNSWRFKARTSLEVEARSQTDWGPLIGYMEFEADFGAGDGDVAWEEPSAAWVALGPFLAGIDQSVFDTGGSYTSPYQLDDGIGGGTAFTDNKLLQLQLSWAFNGFGVILAAEDPNQRVYEFIDSSNQGDIPNLVAALTGEWGSISSKVAFLYMDTDPDSIWGVQGNVEIHDIFGTDRLQLAASYLDGGGDSVWSAQASFRHYWSSNLHSSVTVQYNDFSDFGEGENWAYAFSTDYTPVDDFLIRVGLRHYEVDDTTNALIEFRRSFGG